MAGAAALLITAELVATPMLVPALVEVTTVVVALLPLPSLFLPTANVREAPAPHALAQLLEIAAANTDGAAARLITAAQDVIVDSVTALKVSIMFR